VDVEQELHLPYRPFQRGAFRWRLGLRPLDLADWIELDDHHAADVAEKGRLLAAHHGTVMAALDEPDAARPESLEVLELLVAHLTARFPGRFADLTVADALADGVHPLEAAGRLVQEDLALLVTRGDQLVFGAGCVCFPNRWDLRSKIGRTMAEVHEPVALLNEQLADPIDRFFERLTPERPFWRLGWGVLDTDEHYQPLDGTAPPRPTEPGFHHLHLRVERETLRRLPRTGAILFTIRTHLTPLPRLAAADREQAEVLAEAIEALPPEVADYKQLVELARVATAGLR
jgi:hypothetical protein